MTRSLTNFDNSSRFEGEILLFIASHVTALYIMPVSRKVIPSFAANVRPTVVLPEATGPSIGMLISARFKYSAPCIVSWIISLVDQIDIHNLYLYESP